MLDFRVVRERYLRTLRRDLKELWEIEMQKLDLMYHFIDWVTDEIKELIKLAKRDRCRFDDIESWWKAAAKIVKDGSSLQNADGLEEEPKADGNAQAAAVNEEAV